MPDCDENMALCYAKKIQEMHNRWCRQLDPSASWILMA